MPEIRVVSQLDATHLAQLPPLLEAAARADGHEPIGEHKFLRLRRGEDLATALLAFDHNRLAGYAHTVTYTEGDRRRVSCELVVHPELRRRGVGGSLLVAAIDAARSQDARRFDLWAYNDRRVTSHLAINNGFQAARRLLHLHRHVSDVPAASTPPGASVRAFVPGADDEEWLALNNRIFRGHPENGAWTAADLRGRIEQPWFRAEDLLLFQLNGRLSGFCWLKLEDRPREGRIGEIYVIGTAPEARGVGLGRFALAQGLRRLTERGARLAAIYVDDSNAPAVALYQDAGFHHHHVDVCYSRDLAAAVAPAPAERAAA